MIQLFRVSTGGLSSTLVDPKLVFSKALECKASLIVLAHNHPSGHLKPSDQDEQITAKLVEFGKLLDMYVIDHLIISDYGYFSFADEGLL